MHLKYEEVCKDFVLSEFVCNGKTEMIKLLPRVIKCISDTLRIRGLIYSTRETWFYAGIFC